MRSSLKLYIVIAVGILVLTGPIFSIGFSPSPLSVENAFRFVQETPEVTVVPEVLERISWSGIFAGSFLSLIVMFLLNLLGIALGLSQIHPENRSDIGDVSGIAQGTIAWIGGSNLVALFIGG